MSKILSIIGREKRIAGKKNRREKSKIDWSLTYIYFPFCRILERHGCKAIHMTKHFSLPTSCTSASRMESR